ncbi:uncharacterized protein LOC126260302 [Schistocerca nitens]|uniref:uncharacterized protein LOC126260302 n=1 Tax=Schistocerca nitens TaxID=7011 RepID=UPI002117FAD1|nr:uncharacterized protein LOC126260302 [Schistocerca nitens]
MEASTFAAVASLLVLLGSSPAASYVNPWPKCDLQHNWYSCRSHPGGAVICDLNVKRDTDEPLAVRSTHHHSYSNTSLPAGLDDFGFLYSCVIYEGVIKLSVRLCSTDASFRAGVLANSMLEPPCRKNWYKCDHEGDRTVCRVKLCPWTNSPLVPKSGEVSEWYQCTRKGSQTDCYISNVSAGKHYYSEVDDLASPAVFGPELVETQERLQPAVALPVPGSPSPSAPLHTYRPLPHTVALGRRRTNYRRAFRKLNAEYYHV